MGKIINKIINAGQQIAENKPIEIQRAFMSQEDDVAQIAGRRKTGKSKPSFISKAKKLIRSKRTYIDKATAKQLSKAPVNEFFDTCQRTISTRLGIPENVYAPIKAAELPKDVAMMYDCATNIIYVNSANKTLKFSPQVKYNLIRHEFEHQAQNLNIYRTRGLGEKAVDFYTGHQTKNIMDMLEESFKDLPMDEIHKLKDQLGADYDLVIKYKQALQDGTMGKYTEDLTSAVRNNYVEFRKKVIDGMGEIPENSKEAKKATQHFKEFTTEKDLTSIKTIFGMETELEANLAGFIGQFEFLFAKWFG